MVIDELNVLRTLIGPSETDAELVVHADRPLPRPILLEAVQAVSRRMFEIIEPRRRIQLEEAAPYPLEEVRRKTLGTVALKDLSSLSALPTEDHGNSLPCIGCSESCYISQDICSAIRYADGLQSVGCFPAGFGSFRVSVEHLVRLGSPEKDDARVLQRVLNASHVAREDRAVGDNFANYSADVQRD